MATLKTATGTYKSTVTGKEYATKEQAKAAGSSSSSSKNTSTPTVKVSDPVVTKTSTTAPIATMGTVAKDPVKNISAPSTTLPSNQAIKSPSTQSFANPGVASGVSIWGPSTINTSGGSPFSTNSTSSAANKSTANGLMSSLIPKASASTGSSGSSYTGGSIVDYLSSVGKPSDFNSRSQLASQYGISGYSGTAEQNTQLLNKLRGGSSTTSYSTPAAASPVADSAQQYTQAPTTASVLSPYVASPVAPPAGTPSTGTLTTGAYTAPAGTGLYGQLIADQANRTKGNNEYDQAAKDYQKALKDYNSLKQKMNEQLAATDQEAIPLTFQQGRKQILNQLYAQQLADAAARVTQAQQGMQYATSQYGAETGALQGAIGSAGIVLSGGQYQPFGGENASFQSGLDRQRAVDTYNYNTQTGLDFSGQAAQLDQPMQSLSLLGPQLSNYLTSKGVNPNTNMFVNMLAQGGLKQTDPLAFNIVMQAGNEAKAIIAQIAGTNSSLIPSETTSMAQNMDISSMSPGDLIAFVNAANVIAQTRYSALKSSGSAALSGGFQPFSGQTQSNPTAQIPVTPRPTTSAFGLPNPSSGWDTAIGAGTGLIKAVGGFIPMIGQGVGWLMSKL